MTDANKLVELIKKAKSKMWGKTFHSELERNFFLAEELLANDVFILPEDLRGTEDFSVSAFIEAMKMYKQKDRYIKTPCKVGDKVYMIFENEIRKLRVISLSYLFSSSFNHFNLHTENSRGAVLSYEMKDIGKTVFLTKMEAEAKLKELGK